jgi:hypothetical protein
LLEQVLGRAQLTDATGGKMSVSSEGRGSVNLGVLPYITANIKYGVAAQGVSTYRYDTVDRQRTNLVLQAREMKVHDAASARDRFSYAADGVEIRTHVSKFAPLAATEVIQTAEGLNSLRDRYLEEMSDFVRQLSGTPHVFPQPIGFFVRHGAKSRIKTSQKPAALPHVDFTAQTASEMATLIQRTAAPGLVWRNFAIYQTWRAVSPPPQDSVLCFCDSRTATLADFRVVESIMGPEDKPGNVYQMEMALHSERHEWFYFSGLTAQDVLVFQGYDPRSPRPILHTSVDNPVVGATPRVSIECRHYAFFE